MTTPQTVEPLHTLGMLVLVEERATPLPLELTRVTAQVSGLLVTVLVEQTYANPLEAAAELEYLFPLPHGASIMDFDLRVGRRTVRGELQEIEQARQAFERARAEGRRSGLLESRRPNLFAVRLANVMPGEKIVTRVRYTERLGYNDGSCEFVFPMGITPRYTSPDHPEESQGVHAPVAAVRQEVGPVEIQVSVDAGLAAGDPRSPSNPIEVTRLDERRFNVQLQGRQIPERDFVLRFPVSKDKVGMSVWWTEDAGATHDAAQQAAYFEAALLPPALEGLPEPQAQTLLSREFIFVLDRSGSMMGEPIAQARNALRACLRSLKPEDTFRILLFDDKLEWFQPEASRMSQAEVDAADRFLQQVQGRGGTEILSALEASLSLPEGSGRTRFVVFLTDGAVDAEKRALKRVAGQIGNGRLFVFGIGPSVNRALLEHMADLGRGAAEFLQLDEDIEGAILRFQDRVSFPAITDLALEVEDGQAWDIYPVRLPDLYIGQPLQITGRLRAVPGSSARLVLTGKQGEQHFRLPVSFPSQSANEPALARLWARSRIDDLTNQWLRGELEEHAVRAEIISLALAHKLVTAYTAFVALDSEVVNPSGKAIPILVAQPLPAGLSADGFGLVPVGRASLPAMAPAMAKGFHPLRMQASSVDQSEVYTNTASPASMRDHTARSARFVSERREPAAATIEDMLRQLARTQSLDGSWESSVEQTAAALLSFVRAGYTSRAGHFRRQVQKAADWLAAVQASGFEAFVRALALAELARATGIASEQASALKAAAALPLPSSPLEQAAKALLDEPSTAVPLPTQARSLDDLRLAGLLGKPIDVDTDRSIFRSTLAGVWLALTKPTR